MKDWKYFWDFSAIFCAMWVVTRASSRASQKYFLGRETSIKLIYTPSGWSWASWDCVIGILRARGPGARLPYENPSGNVALSTDYSANELMSRGSWIVEASTPSAVEALEFILSRSYGSSRLRLSFSISFLFLFSRRQ